jgi:carbon-monoxide dehydrogenase large subunit
VYTWQDMPEPMRGQTVPLLVPRGAIERL